MRWTEAPGAWDFEVIEGAARRAALRVAARVVEQRLSTDHNDHRSATVPSPCGRAALPDATAQGGWRLNHPLSWLAPKCRFANARLEPDFR